MLILDILMQRTGRSSFQRMRLMSQQIRWMLIQRRTTFIAVTEAQEGVGLSRTTVLILRYR